MKKVKLLHIVPDDKFIDDTIEVFSEISADSSFVSFAHNLPYRYISRHSCDVIPIEQSKLLEKIDIEGYQIVMFHSLSREYYDLVLNIPLNVKVWWSAWGFDLYCEQFYDGRIIPPILDITLLRNKTKFLIKHGVVELPITKLLKRSIKSLYRNILQLPESIENYFVIKQEKNKQCQFLSRIDYMSVVLPSEYDALCKIKEFKAEYFPWQYVSNVKGLGQVVHPFVSESASTILFGNSATPTNNHIDIYALLKKRKIKNTCVVPLSYGDNYYKDLLFNVIGDDEQFQLLLDFIPKDIYYKLLLSCRIGVFGHIRQQAMGNILILIRQGCKVYLYKDSIAYKYLHREGFIVFTIEEDLYPTHIEKLLTKEEQQWNRNNADKHFSFEKVVNGINKKLNEKYA